MTLQYFKVLYSTPVSLKLFQQRLKERKRKTESLRNHTDTTGIIWALRPVARSCLLCQLVLWGPFLPTKSCRNLGFQISQTQSSSFLCQMQFKGQMRGKKLGFLMGQDLHWTQLHSWTSCRAQPWGFSCSLSRQHRFELSFLHLIRPCPTSGAQAALR